MSDPVVCPVCGTTLVHVEVDFTGFDAAVADAREAIQQLPDADTLREKVASWFLGFTRDDAIEVQEVQR